MIARRMAPAAVGRCRAPFSYAHDPAKVVLDLAATPGRGAGRDRRGPSRRQGSDLTAHSDEEGAAPTAQRSYGRCPL